MVSNFLSMLAMAAMSMAAAIPEAAVAPVSNIGPTGEIVGGSAASSGQFPYQVALLRSGSLFCGGVLINARTVLTAAHCSTIYSASQVQVRAGSLVSFTIQAIQLFPELSTDQKLDLCFRWNSCRCFKDRCSPKLQREHY